VGVSVLFRAAIGAVAAAGSAACSALEQVGGGKHHEGAVEVEVLGAELLGFRLPGSVAIHSCIFADGRWRERAAFEAHRHI
jgi:hypothetical protein